MKISAQLKELLANTKLAVLPEDYVVIHLPLDAQPLPGEWYRPATTRFAVFIREPKEIILVVPRRKWLRMQSIFEKYEISGPMKVITFDVQLSLVKIGYMSAIGAVMTKAQIRANPISTFHRDHILVSKGDLPRTVRVIRDFLDSCKKELALNKTK
jgi:hypothetical protein